MIGVRLPIVRTSMSELFLNRGITTQIRNVTYYHDTGIFSRKLKKFHSTFSKLLRRCASYEK